jgi:hypothetical protein
MSDYPVSTTNIASYFDGEYWVNQRLFKHGKLADEVDVYSELTQFDRF